MILSSLNVCIKNTLTGLAVWLVAPSWINATIASSPFSHKHGTTFKRRSVKKCWALTVTTFHPFTGRCVLKKKGPMIEELVNSYRTVTLVQQMPKVLVLDLVVWILHNPWAIQFPQITESFVRSATVKRLCPVFTFFCSRNLCRATVVDSSFLQNSFTNKAWPFT